MFTCGLQDMTNPSSYRILSIFTAISASASFCTLFVAVTTDHWLYTTEKSLDPNGTIVQVDTYSGLWKKCTSHENKNSACSYINYFNHVDRDGLGSTESILLSLRRATLFPMASIFMMVTAQLIILLGHCKFDRHKQMATAVFGVLYIIVGLSLFVGLIIYIGSITEVATVANRSKSGPDAVFLYSYGTSLVLTVIAFFGAELTGVLAVHLCLSVIRRNRLKHLERKSTVQSVISGNGFAQTETKSAHACAHVRTHARDAAWTDVPVGMGDGGSPSSSEIIYAEVVPSELTVAPVHIVRQGSWKSLFHQAPVYSESCGNGKIHSEKQRSCLSIDGILHSQALRRITPV